MTDPEEPLPPRPFVRPRPELPSEDPLLADDGLEVPPPPLGGAPEGEGEGDQEKVMTLIEHLSELRFRILASLGAVLACACVTLYYSAPLTQVILATAPKVQFIALTPMEVFFTQLKIGLLTALIAAVPVITWQIWSFIRPGLREEEAAAVGWFGPVTSLLFLTGSAFAFKVVVPVGVDFLSSFSLPGVTTQYSLEAYTSFVLFMVLAMGLIFESPVVIVILARLGLVTSSGLANRRRYVILGCFIVAAIITPTPDMVTQSLVAIPLWLLFEGTLIALKILGW